MSAQELTDTTIRYLFATVWLPTTDREDIVAVPGGATKALDTAANLLHCAMWNLRSRGLMDFEQLRPVEDEPVRSSAAGRSRDSSSWRALRRSPAWRERCYGRPPR